MGKKERIDVDCPKCWGVWRKSVNERRVTCPHCGEKVIPRRLAS
jgi:DNA-directed RNA polymerase subunit RPC12/RpoP